jgi:GxxExxY protein
VYEVVLTSELQDRGLTVVRPQAIPISYKGVQFPVGFRADLIVNDLVIVEVKSVEELLPVHKKRLVTYLRLADRQLGLWINFGARLIKDGITRVVNGLQE